jgi:predicted enzyme related to lactoylglutathione lyase
MVDDVQRAVETTKDRGGQVVSGPLEVPGGDWIAVGIDPQGAVFAVHARKRT